MKTRVRITPKQAEEIHAATIKNIVDKVAAGGVPTKRESDMLKSATKEAPGKVKGGLMAASISAAAAMMECSTVALKQAKKNGAPGFRSNGSVCISELRPWLEENRDALGGDEKSSLECRRLLAQCEKLEFQNEVERGTFTHNDLLREQGMRIGATTRSELLRFKADVPTWEGLPAAEMERRVSTMNDSICKSLNDALSKIYAKP